ncbi:hypothetical protein [Nesterenkonia ebinurensis]|uniref:hypothetical protein n=1 Tax=Nesterenkonia ebinurensis TaxID=2608252 RepID=UPI00295EF815|nr:hypothetical protein [Nesterenkonia ebinurensis]
MAEQVKLADVVIGAVLVPRAATPRLVSDEKIATRNCLRGYPSGPRGLLGGGRPTIYDSPTFQVHDAKFHCIANMPGAVPLRSLLHSLTPHFLTYSRLQLWDGKRGDENGHSDS